MPLTKEEMISLLEIVQDRDNTISVLRAFREDLLNRNTWLQSTVSKQAEVIRDLYLEIARLQEERGQPVDVWQRQAFRIEPVDETKENERTCLDCHEVYSETCEQLRHRKG